MHLLFCVLLVTLTFITAVSALTSAEWRSFPGNVVSGLVGGMTVLVTGVWLGAGSAHWRAPWPHVVWLGVLLGIVGVVLGLSVVEVLLSPVEPSGSWFASQVMAYGRLSLAVAGVVVASLICLPVAGLARRQMEHSRRRRWRRRRARLRSGRSDH